MRDAVLGWIGFIALVLFVAHVMTKEPSEASKAASASIARSIEVQKIRMENARPACAQGVRSACDAY